jgi:hypothetical protein
MTTTNEKAAKLLEMLQANQGGAVEELQLITPGVNAFLQASRKMTTALVDNVKDFKAIGQEKDDVICDILNFKVVSRGATNDNLKAFAVTGSFSLYAQQYNRKKMPLITIAPIMEMMVMIYNHLNVDNVEALEDNTTEALVKAFQFYLVQEVKTYEEDHAMDIDFEEAWCAAGLARGRLLKNPLYYHSQWMGFFNDEFKTVAALVNDYDSALDYRCRMTNVTNKIGAANAKTQDLVQASANIHLAAVDNIKVDQQINLLKDVANQQGDDADMYSEAQKLNANKIIQEIGRAGGDPVKTVGRPDVIDLVKLLAEVDVVEDTPKLKRRSTKKVAKKATLSAPPPAVKGRGKGAYYATAFAFKGQRGGKRPREESSDSDSDSDSYQTAQSNTRKRSRRVIDSDDEMDNEEEDPSAFLGDSLDKIDVEDLPLSMTN